MALLIVSGGTTPQRYFARSRREPIDWARVAITLADERRVADDSPALQRQARARDAAARRGRRPRSSAPLADSRLSPEPGARGGQCADRATCRCPPIWSCSGMGDDGHTASWFPGADSLAEAINPGARALVVRISAPGAPRAAAHA